MASSRTYVQRTRVRHCPRCAQAVADALVYCPACRADQRAYYHEHTLTGILPLVNGPLLACCGGWWNITGLPLEMPCCGKIFFEEEENTDGLC